MTLSAIKTIVIKGLDTRTVTIESVFTRGFSAIQLIGNPSDVCREGKDRARAALETVGIALPAKRIVINLEPAEIRKDGSQLDLALAISLAQLCQGYPPQRPMDQWLFVAELSVSGELKPVRGIASLLIHALKGGYKGLVISPGNLAEIQAMQKFSIPGLEALICVALPHLSDVLAWLQGGGGGVSVAKPLDVKPLDSEQLSYDDMDLTPKQERLAQLVAVGGHSLFLRGTPGVGKSMFARRLPSLFPKMAAQTHVESLQMHSLLKSSVQQTILAGHPPMRSPHHQASAVALTGSAELPGELSLAHGGVLFLDELSEFRRDLLESLREPLEMGTIHVARTKGKVRWPSKVVLVAASNDCPCGWYGSKRKTCHCPTSRVLSYQNRISGAILDRIDIHWRMPEKDTNDLSFLNSHALRKQRALKLKEGVERAWEFAQRRNRRFGVERNSDIPAGQLLECMGRSEHTVGGWLQTFVDEVPSRRRIVRVLRVARTLADLRLSERVTEEDVQEAILWQKRPFVMGS